MSTAPYQAKRETKSKCGKKSGEARRSNANRRRSGRATRIAGSRHSAAATPGVDFRSAAKLMLRNERPFYCWPLKLISRTERIETG